MALAHHLVTQLGVISNGSDKGRPDPTKVDTSYKKRIAQAILSGMS